MIATSRMSGTSSMVVRPVASSDAAMSFSALFFAPVTRTRPVQDRAAGHLEALHAATLRRAPERRPDA